MSIKLNAKYTEDFVSKTDLESIAPEIKKAHKTLTEKSGAGNDFLGWVDFVNHRITIWYAKIHRRYSSPETV